MRRIPVFISVCILAAICITVAACVPLTIVAERNRDDVVREVISMGYDEILFIGGGERMSGSQLMRSSGEEGVWHVLAVKDGEKRFVLVPLSEDYPPYEAPWPFLKTFDEMTALLNAGAGEEIYKEEDIGNIGIEDLEPKYIPQAPGGNDSALALVVKDRRIVQSGGTLYFFREDADAESGFVPEFTESEAQAALGEADHE